MNSQNTLDSFETALLAELRAEVVRNDGSGDGADVHVLPQRPRPRRWPLVAAAGVAAALTAGLAVHAVLPTPAYAVTGGNGSAVTVKVMRLEGAEGLERALEKRGIPADVTFLSEGQACAPGRYRPAGAKRLRLNVAVDWFEVVIPAHAIGKGETFVLTASVQPIQDGFRAAVDYDVAAGAVAPCRVVAR